MNYQDKCLKCSELLEIFPEAKDIVPQLYERYIAIQHGILIKSKGSLKEALKFEGRDKIFWSEMVKLDLSIQLQDLTKNIKRLKQLMRIINKCENVDVERAREVSILEILDVELKKKGKYYVGSCPFHKDNTPSFYVYPDTNSFYCFSCSQGGDVIRYVMIKNGLGFIDACKYLGGK